MRIFWGCEGKHCLVAVVLLGGMTVGLAGRPAAAQMMAPFVDSGQSLGNSRSRGVALGDLDGDSDLDAFVANTDNEANRVWLNDGTGVMTVTTQTVGSGNSYDVALGDLDGDGDLDAFVANYDQPNRVWLNDGAATFTATAQTLGSLRSGGVSLGDLDGDGDLDAFVANHQQPNKVWLNDGTGTFTVTAQSLGSFDSRGVAVGDLDGDGDLDAFVANMATQPNKVWLNDGAGTFTATAQSLGSFESYDVGLGDLDGDGDLDAFVVNWRITSLPPQPGLNRVWINDGSGSFTDSGQMLGGSDSNAVDLADVDFDGDFDAFVANEQANTVWLNDGAGLFTGIALALGGRQHGNIALGDLDGDGDFDAFVAKHRGQANKVLVNKMIHRNATFPFEHIVAQAYDGATAADAADMDGDGDLDIAGSSPHTYAIAWWENTNALGTAWTSHTVAYFGQVMSLSLADMNGDGDTDIVACEYKGSVVWWENGDSAGTSWIAHGIASGLDGAVDVDVSDLDGDGDLDVLVAAIDDDLVAWSENTNSIGTAWALHTVDATFNGAVSVCAADVDRDGDLDVIGAALLGNQIAWWENTNGIGTVFVKHLVDANFHGARNVVATDMDADGDLDILGAANQAHEIAWWENANATGTIWVKHSVQTGFGGACCVRAADIDSDGDPDLVGAACDSNVIAWWPNRGGQFGLPTADTAPPGIAQGEADDVLGIVARHNGRPGDADVELVTFELLFTDGAGDPLTSAAADALMESLFIYLDDGSGSFETTSDTLVTSAPTLALTSGVLTVAFVDGDPNVAVSTGTTKMYFVVVELTPDASLQTPNRFRITHITESSSTAEDRDFDAPLRMEYVPDTPSGLVVADGGPPWVDSIARDGPSPTNATTVTFTVTFNEAVTGVDVGDFDLTTTGVVGATVTLVSTGTSTYAVTVNTGSGEGEIRLDLLDDDSIIDFIAQPLGGPGVGNGDFRSGAVYVIDTISPTVAISSAAPNPTNVSPIVVTVTFSEAVTGFELSDIVPSNATVANFGGSGANYSFDLVPSGAGLVTADIAAGVAQDAVGNGNTAAAQFSRTFDDVAPTVAMSSAAPDPTNVSPIPVTITFSEAVTGFESSDITPSNATVANFSGSGANYSFDLVPAGAGVVTAGIAAGVAQDAAGNGNTAAAQFRRTFDDVAPTVAMSSTAPDPTNISPIPVTATFSEPVTGFETTDITPGNATVANFSGSGANYSFDLVPSGPGTVTADIAAGVAQDAAGNGNTAAAQFSRLYDDVVPVVQSVLRLDANPTSAALVRFEVRFGKAVSGVDITDFDLVTTGVAGTTVTLVSAGPTTYTVAVDTGSGDGAIRLDVVDDDSIVDGVGNSLAGAADGSYRDGEVYGVDRTAPTVTMNSVAPDPTNVSPIPVTVAFSEPVTGFESLDIEPANATVASFSGSGARYSFDLVPQAPGVVVADIGPRVAQDAAGNGNMAAAQFRRHFDDVAPTAAMTSVAPDPTNVSPIPVTVTFSEPVTGFESSDILPVNATVANCSGSGANYGFDLVPLAPGLVTAAVVAGGAHDAAGNGNVPAGPLYRHFDDVAPTAAMTSVAPDPTHVSPIPVAVTFSETVTGFESSDISPSNATVANFSGFGANYSLDLVALAPGLVTADIAAGAAHDLAGNANTAAAQFSRLYVASLAAPSNLTATAVSSSQIRLSWQDNADNEDGFEIERARYLGRYWGDWTRIASVGPNETNYDDSGLPPGGYRYRVRAFHGMGDSPWSNTASASAMTVGPNLTGSLASVTPQSVAWGEPVFLSGQVANIGDRACTTGFWIEFWAVNQATGWTGFLCDSIAWGDPLGVGDAIDLSSFTTRCIYGIPAGTYAIEMIIDPTMTVTESNELDNGSVWSPLTILPDSPETGPNLVGSLEGVTPWKVVWGDHVSFSGQVTNIGDRASTTGFWIEFWAVNQATGWRGFLCDSIAHWAPLAAGEGIDLSSFTARAVYGGLPAGTYDVWMVIDPVGTVLESNELDNESVWSPMTVLPDLPNLAIGHFDFAPQDVTSSGGVGIAFSGMIENNGTQPTMGSFLVEFRIWPDPDFQPDGPHLTDPWEVSRILQPGETVDLASMPTRTTRALEPGVYCVGVLIDPLGNITEQHEHDNMTWLIHKRLYVGPRPTHATRWQLYR